MFHLAVVGAGRMGRTHVAALQSMDDVAVIGVVEPVAQVRAALAEQGIRTYESVPSLLQDAAPEAWLVAVPTPQHLVVIEALVATGLPILCEKPAGSQVAQTERIAELARTHNVRIQVAYWRRFIPALRDLRDRLQSFDFGEIQAITCQQWDQAPPGAEFRAGSGGIFIDMGVHEIDQLRWLTGDELRPVAAIGRMDQPTGDFDSAQGLVELTSGASGVISLGRYHPPGDMVAVEVFGSRGQARVEVLEPATGDLVFAQALQAQVRGFLDGQGASLNDAIAAHRIASTLQQRLSDSSRAGEFG